MGKKQKAISAFLCFLILGALVLGPNLLQSQKGAATVDDCIAGLMKCEFVAVLTVFAAPILGAGMMAACYWGYLFCLEFLV